MTKITPTRGIPERQEEFFGKELAAVTSGGSVHLPLSSVHLEEGSVHLPNNPTKLTSNPEAKTMKKATRNEMLEAIKEALVWLDPNCNLDGERKSEDRSDRDNMIIELYEIVDREAIAKAEGV